MDRMDILSNIEDPVQLEKLYRYNKSTFKTEFNLIYPELQNSKLASFWNERLNYESSEITWGSSKEISFVIIAAIMAGVIAKIPAIFNIDEDFFYPRNAAFIVFPVLTFYFIWRKGLTAKKITLPLIITLITIIFINFFPENQNSDTLILSCIHLPLILWGLLGFSFVGGIVNDHQKRLDFLRYNGDLVIITTLILIAGGILTGITIGLFSVIGFEIENFYLEYIAIFGAAASPVVGTYITQANPQVVSKISPVIAKIFSPLVLITLVIYLVAMIFSGRDPYNDREFLMIFNGLLIGVMAIIFFSVAGQFKQNENRTNTYILFGLSVITIIINGIALSAILFRISEWGITPNRLAVVGGNILMLTHLLIITFRLFKHVSKKSSVSEVEISISKFLPVYIAWAMIVTFVFPFIFHYR